MTYKIKIKSSPEYRVGIITSQSFSVKSSQSNTYKVGLST